MIVGDDRTVGQTNHHKTTTAKIARRRIRDSQPETDRHRSVYRVPTLTQNICSDL